VVQSGAFAAAGITNQGKPHPHGWYTVEVLAYFNGPWEQPEAVMQIVGREGEYLVGRFAEPLHPEFSDSEKYLHASFECIAPRQSSVRPWAAPDIEKAIAVTRKAVLNVDGRISSAPIGEVVEYFMSPPLRIFNGWSAKATANGSILVTFSFWNGDTPAESQWIVVLTTSEVRYANVYAKYMSWLPDY
jgi:hypothetical protein